MDNKNKLPQKQKDKEVSVLTSVLAEFDIQTQVNKMVMRSFDTLMRTNKQAFDFIKQSQHKFITFQQRLSKAQTYYKNIETNINSKIQLTNNMDKRLQQFANQFWNGMKQNNNEMIMLTKKLEQLNLEKNNMENSLSQCDTRIKRQQNISQNLNSKINQQIQKILLHRNQTQLSIQQKFHQQASQIKQLTNSIIQSKSLLQSKSQILSQLLKDLEIYKNDRPEIMKQIEKLFEELEYRSLKFETVELRGYVDSRIVAEAERVSNLWMRVDTQIKVEERDRKREDQRIVELIQTTKQSLQEQNKQNQSQSQQKVNQLSTSIQLLSSSLNSQLQKISFSLTQTQFKYQKQIPEIIKKSLQDKKIVQDMASKLTANTNQLQEMESSIQSANQLIQQIVRQNNQRREELNNLKANSQSQGNIGQQIIVIFQKLANIQKDFSLFKDVKTIQLQKIQQTIQTHHSQFQQTSKQISTKIFQTNTQLQNSISKSLKQITSVDTNLRKIIRQLNQSLQTKIQNSQSSTNTLIQQKILSIKDQLDQLDRIHEEIQQFKNTFKKQIQQNDKVNVSIAEKMERVAAQFTKLKSDNTVKFENISIDLTKKTQQIKTSLLDLTQIKKYLSVSNQCVNLLLALAIFKDSNTKQSHTIAHQANSSLHLPTENKQMGNQQNSKAIKISSILEGWILQTQENNQKAKFRGEHFNIQTRLKLPQLYLQFLVKQAQKIKGTILQNGRDLFIKILQSGEDVFQQRKKTNSKRKPSELPKLYM